jgi:hypothetical protein
MIHTEKLKKAGGTLEVRFNEQGEAVHVFIKRKRAKVFNSLEAFIAHVYLGVDVECFACSEDELFDLYESDTYEYKKLKSKKENPDNPNQLKLWEQNN